MSIYDYSPFDETIFIDADTFVIRDISDWWHVFEESEHDVAVWGWNCTLDSPRVGKLLSAKAIEKYMLSHYIGFNGGVYYFRKSAEAAGIFKRATQLLETYIEDELHLYNGKMGDEPVMAIAMIEHGIYGTEDPNKERMFCTPGMTDLKIDVVKQLCVFKKYDYFCRPAVMHWGTAETKGRIYVREAKKVSLYLKGYPYSICCIVANILSIKSAAFIRRFRL